MHGAGGVRSLQESEIPSHPISKSDLVTGSLEEDQPTWSYLEAHPEPNPTLTALTQPNALFEGILLGEPILSEAKAPAGPTSTNPTSRPKANQHPNRLEAEGRGPSSSLFLGIRPPQNGDVQCSFGFSFGTPSKGSNSTRRNHTTD